MKRILLCEDETAIRSFVEINLRRAGYIVLEAGSGEEALEKYSQCGGQVDLALLDVMLPGMDGFAVCSELRRRNPDMGIIMLTARTQESEKVQGFCRGADDYVTKPFSPSELMARVGALLRRVGPPVSADERLEHGPFLVDLREHSVKKNGAVIEMPPIEFQILQYLFVRPGRIISRQELLNQVWHEGNNIDDKVVDVNIRRIRMKIEEDPSRPQYLVTVRGQGYYWAD